MRPETRQRDAISIHALLAESDVEEVSGDTWVRDFYPRSPCGERPIKGKPAPPVVSISIHALLAESDGKSNKPAGKKLVFLSTLSLRRATVGAIGQLQCIPDFYPRSPCGERQQATYFFLAGGIISIHALLAESDRMPLTRFFRGIFLSTLSLRRATLQS